jgi:aminobenzoyl-glutamate utilization protein B
MSRAKEIALSWVDGNRDLIVGLSDSIWEYAELPMREFRSSRLIAETLEEQGFEVELGVAGMPTAIEASWGAGKPIVAI